MVILFIGLIICAAILYGALHILVGWILGAEASKRMSRTVDRIGTLYLKLLVVLIAAGIVWVIVLAVKQP